MVRTRPRPDLVERRRAAALRIAYPPELPVSGRRDELREAIRDHQVVVVAGETGSGKTTQLPKLCLELGRGLEGMIAHTQPRRLAARTVAERIASELGTELGGAVGYAVRFTDRSRPETRLRLMTDGLLRRRDPARPHAAPLRHGDRRRGARAQPQHRLPARPPRADPPEAARPEADHHLGDDRSAPLRAALRRGRPGRSRSPAARTRSRSATARSRTPRISTATRRDAIGDAVEELLREPPGDVLVFLSGEREIRDTAEALAGRLPQDVELLPLYARLSTREQQRVFKPSGARRVVLATNVAETSLTVPGIRYVVDPGLRAHQPLQRAPEGPAAADREDQPGVGEPAQGPLRPRRRRHLHPPLRRGGLRGAAAVHRPGDPAHEPRRA